MLHVAFQFPVQRLSICSRCFQGFDNDQLGAAIQSSALPTPILDSTVASPMTVPSPQPVSSVGAGAAGATLAGRLSEDASTTVLLLEAGKEAPFNADIPLFCGVNYHSDSGANVSWNYLTEPQTVGCRGYINHTCDYFAGKALGGGSTVNFMVYVRGSPHDFELWAEGGATGWSYEDVLPYFIKSEGATLKNGIDECYHGTSGPLSVSYPKYHSDLRDTYLAAAKEKNYKVLDINGATQTGFGPIQGTLRDGYRCSTEKAYLKPASGRKNLKVITSAYVTKIPLIVDLAVGFNFQDHISCNGIPIILNDNIGVTTEEVVETIEKFRANEKNPVPLEGLLSSPTTIEAIGYLKSKFETYKGDYPDVQLFLSNGFIASEFLKPEVRQYYLSLKDKHVFNSFIANIHPRQRGTISLRNTNAFDYPIITFDYLANETDLNILAFEYEG